MKINIIKHIKKYTLNYILITLLVITIILNWININKKPEIIKNITLEDNNQNVILDDTIDYLDNDEYDNYNEEKDEINFIININTASKEELVLLEGIGEKTAEKIIDFREQSLFITKEDIKKVSGIGDIKYNNICNNITI